MKLVDWGEMIDSRVGGGGMLLSSSPPFVYVRFCYWRRGSVFELDITTEPFVCLIHVDTLTCEFIVIDMHIGLQKASPEIKPANFGVLEYTKSIDGSEGQSYEVLSMYVQNAH